MLRAFCEKASTERIMKCAMVITISILGIIFFHEGVRRYKSLLEKTQVKG